VLGLAWDLFPFENSPLARRCLFGYSALRDTNSERVDGTVDQ
jgi:hypothetical protein